LYSCRGGVEWTSKLNYTIVVLGLFGPIAVWRR